MGQEWFREESDRLLRADRWDEQRLLMAWAVEEFPEEPEFWYRYALGSFHVSDAHVGERLSVAARLGADDPSILTRAASLVYDLGEYDLAQRWLTQAGALVTEDFPLLADMLHLIGRLALVKHEEGIAEEYLARAFEADPGSPGFAHFLATLLARRENYDQALEAIDRALAHDAPDASALLDLRRQIEAIRDSWSTER